MTSFNHSYDKFTDFLQDPRFIHWKLFPTAESEAYWHDFLEQNPLLRPLFREAEQHFANIKIEPNKLSEIEKQGLWERVRHPKSSPEASKLFFRFPRKWISLTAACASIVLVIVLGVLIPHRKPAKQQLDTKNMIVGNLLKETEIQLIAGNTALSFRHDVRVKVSQTGEMEIIRENQVEKTVEITHNQQNKLITPHGRRTQLSLSDGSQVWLNSGSVLEFPVQFSEKKREICLISGEMYIEVASDKHKPFRVKTSDFTVNVSGTKFNLSAYANLPQSVVLVEGSVSLQSDGKEKVRLLPGEQAIYTGGNKNFDTRKVDPLQFITWTDGYLIFDKTPISQVLQQVERYYNLSFDIHAGCNLKDNTCTGKLSLSQNLDDVMNTIARISDTDYTRNNRTIYISSKKLLK